MALMCYNNGVQGNRRTVAKGDQFEDSFQLGFNGIASLRRDPVTNSASGFPEQKLAEGVTGFSRLNATMPVQFTWVYLMRDRETGFYKIGQSVDPNGRLKQLRRQDTKQPTPNDFELIEAWWTYERDEKRLHRMFASCRRRGEWFELAEKHLQRLHVEMQCRQTYTKLASDNSDRELYLKIAAECEDLKLHLSYSRDRVQFLERTVLVHLNTINQLEQQLKDAAKPRENPVVFSKRLDGIPRLSDYRKK